MGAERLTTLAAVKDWLGIENDDSDVALLRVINAASRYTLNYLNRPTLLRASYTQQWVGNGKSAIMLNQWPILGITSVGIGSASIPAATFTGAGPTSGYMLSDDRPGYRMLNVYGYSFYRGSGAQVIFQAGFETSEADLIPATPFQLTPTTGGQWSIVTPRSIDH